MESIKGRKVLLARLHGVTHVPGLGQVGPTIDGNTDKASGLGTTTLTLEEGGVYCESPKAKYFIPFGNIQSIAFPLITPAAPIKK